MYHTVWEIENYSTIQIPSEIIFGDFAIKNEKLKMSNFGKFLIFHTVYHCMYNVQRRGSY